MEFYQLQSPSKGPKTPTRWSHSALTAWRSCPRRWWLERADYSNAPKPYPRRPSTAAIKGRLVHSLLEHFTTHTAHAPPGSRYEEVRASFPVRSLLTTTLRKLRSAELDHNPRVNVDRLLARLSLDDCVNAFRRAAPAAWNAASAGSGSSSMAMCSPGRSASASSDSATLGAEAFMECSIPPLTGRLDFIDGDAITDFKTGEPNEDHWEQLRFYSVLAAGTGVPVRELRLIYTDDGSVVTRAAPSSQELEMLRAQLADEIRGIVRVLEQGDTPAARANVETCRYCSVRHHCDEYWSSDATGCLRLSEAVFASPDAPAVQWLDAEVRLTEEVNPVAVGYADRAIASSEIECIARIDARRFKPVGPTDRRLRVLGTKVSRGADAISLECVQDTEVFWLGDL